MVKDSKKYAAAGGWGFADFTGEKPGERLSERGATKGAGSLREST
jgi:hypothetical protein